jgi:hypothetical protein
VSEPEGLNGGPTPAPAVVGGGRDRHDELPGKQHLGPLGIYRGRNGSPGLTKGGTWIFETRYRSVANVGRLKENSQRRETGPERWARWRKLLDEGTYKSRAELARAEGVTRAAVTQALKAIRRA